MRYAAIVLGACAVSVAASRLETRDDAQSSKTLLDSQIQTVTNSGTPEAGQVNSALSTNNFINFCATKNLPLTNGVQVKTGSCNPVIMGVILSTDRLPSAKFIEPRNLGVVQSNTNFTISLKIKNLSTGFFTNPATTYFAAPSDTNSDGFLLAHSHVAVDKISSIDSTEVGDALNFAFFKGLNGKSDENGVLTTVVAGGLPEGDYRVCSINTAANHQPVLGSVAQHASFDDCVYFSATADGKDPTTQTAVAAQGATAKTNTGTTKKTDTGKKGTGKKVKTAQNNVVSAETNFVDTNTSDTTTSNGSDTNSASNSAQHRAVRLRRRAAHQRRAAEIERLRRQRMSD